MLNNESYRKFLWHETFSGFSESDFNESDNESHIRKRIKRGIHPSDT